MLTVAGAAVSLSPDQCSAEAIAERTRTLLPRNGSSAQRDAALVIAEEIVRMPSPAEVARMLPDLIAP